LLRNKENITKTCSNNRLYYHNIKKEIEIEEEEDWEREEEEDEEQVD
jgi:hypothetical protein